MAPQITNISAAATNSSGSVTGMVRNSNKIRGQSTSTGATMYASAKSVSTQASPRIAAVITSTNRIRVQTATVGNAIYIGTPGRIALEDNCDSAMVDANYTSGTSSILLESGDPVECGGLLPGTSEWRNATTSAQALGCATGGGMSLTSTLNDLADVMLTGTIATGAFLVFQQIVNATTGIVSGYWEHSNEISGGTF